MVTHLSERRVLVELLEREFDRLLGNLGELVRLASSDVLYQRPPSPTLGESILRSASIMEQTFGGLTANLWDDPFEWTLPENLSTPDRLREYLSEVSAARQRAFLAIAHDNELFKYVSVPAGEPKPLVSLLLETLVRASNHHGQASATLKILSDVGARGFII